MGSSEQEEAFALRLVANGQGTHHLEEHPQYDESHVAFWLEEPGRVTVYLRRDGETRREYHFRVVPTDAPPDPVHEDEDDPPPREVRMAVAKRFLCDSLDILHHSPESLRRDLLKQALGLLVEAGQVEEEDRGLLADFVDAWPSRLENQGRGGTL